MASWVPKYGKHRDTWITDQELRIGTLWEKHDLRSKFCKSILHCVLPVLSSLRPGCPVKGTPCFNTYSLLVSGTRMTILHRLTKYWGSLVEKRGRGLNLLNATQLVWWILGKVLDCTQLGKVSAVEASWWHVGAWELSQPESIDGGGGRIHSAVQPAPAESCFLLTKRIISEGGIETTLDKWKWFVFGLSTHVTNRVWKNRRSNWQSNLQAFYAISQYLLWDKINSRNRMIWNIHVEKNAVPSYSKSVLAEFGECALYWHVPSFLPCPVLS